jgi:RNA polymerase sigma factor (sigma-70 family)
MGGVARRPWHEFGGGMKHSGSSNVSPDVEPPPTATHDVDPSPVRAGGDMGVDGFVVGAYEAHHAEVYGFLARATRDATAAEDLLQETYLRLTQEARAGQAPHEVRAWLYRVASNLVISRARRQTTARRWPSGSGQWDDQMIAPSPEAGVVGREGVAEMERVLEGLSADARLALLLSAEGFGGEDIAATIGRSVAATRTLLSRARARVRIRRELFAEQAR